jgi:hypothetical protein
MSKKTVDDRERICKDVSLIFTDTMGGIKVALEPGGLFLRRADKKW